MPDIVEIENQEKRHGTICLSGRQKIFSTIEDVTTENIIQFLQPVLSAFYTNKFEMEYLYWYRRGIQPILWREKEIRPDILNKVVANIADELTIFKNGYFLTKDAFYVSRSDDAAKTKAVDELNEYLYLSGKHKADNEVVNWFHTVGVGVMYLEANKDAETSSSCPVNVYALDPRCSFVVYSLRPGNPPIAGVNLVATSDEKVTIQVYTKNFIYTCEGGYKNSQDTTPELNAQAFQLVGEPVENAIGEVPIIEYVMNENRMACFESVIPLMDQVNNIMSNASDGIEQFIQSLCVATNCQFEEGTTAKEIRQAGMITLTSTDGAAVDFKILTEELDQSQTQITINNLLDRINSIAGVPFSTNATGGTSDNVGAVYLRNGYEIADTFVRDTEDCFRHSNRQFDKVLLKILQKVLGNKAPALTVGDIDVQFSRSELENLLTKSQAALNLKQFGLAPEVILEKTNLSNDPVSDVVRSKKYIEQAWAVADKKDDVPNVSDKEESSDDNGMENEDESED